ncbi:MAG: crAss001_48 related protein [Fusobacteriaceae bacterium]
MTHIERMKLELEELNEKIMKGSEFLEGEEIEPKFLDYIQIDLMKQQLKHMRGYSDILRHRIMYDSNKQ